MNSVRLGKTEIVTPKNGFGALPIQRISDDEAVKIVRRAFESGMTYFDTARGYTDSEHKLGLALSDVRDKVFIATKTMATDGEGLRRDLETSLKELNTDYIDLYQFHNPAVCPKPGDGSGLYEAALEAKAQGIIRHIGITNHRLAVAHEAIESGLFETLQFPFCYLATDKDIEIVLKCKAADMGFIAMKSMSDLMAQCTNARSLSLSAGSDMWTFGTLTLFFPLIIPLFCTSQRSFPSSLPVTKRSIAPSSISTWAPTGTSLTKPS